MSKKKVRILIEMPEKWVDLESPWGIVSNSVRQMVERNVIDVLVTEYVARQKLPKIKITVKEIKEKMLELMAKKALEDNNL